MFDKIELDLNVLTMLLNLAIAYGKGKQKANFLDLFKTLTALGLAPDFDDYNYIKKLEKL